MRWPLVRRSRYEQAVAAQRQVDDSELELLRLIVRLVREKRSERGSDDSCGPMSDDFPGCRE